MSADTERRPLPDPEQGVPPAAFLSGADVYIVYSFEDVAFHWGAATGIVRRRFRGEDSQSETPFSNRLYFDGKMGGRIATRQEYEAW